MGKAARQANADKRAQAAHSRRERARQAEQRTRTTRLVVLGVIAVLAIAGVAFTISSAGGDKEAKIPAAAVAADGYGIVFNADATPTIDIWEDPQCPACKTFETASGEFINSLARDGRAKIVFHPLSFLGDESKTAANALACASDEGKFLEFHTTMYANQPSGENTKVWTEDAMVDLGRKAGITSEAFATCVKDGVYDGWVRNIAEDGAKRNVNQTPTMWFNNREVDRNAYLDPTRLESILKTLGMK
jgi:protein-disulfide isomerase